MKQRKEQVKINMGLPTYISRQTSKYISFWDLIGYDQSITSYPKKKEEDLLSFMGMFTFPKIASFKKSLAETRKYTKKQIYEIVEGLEDLPEYAK